VDSRQLGRRLGLVFNLGQPKAEGFESDESVLVSGQRMSFVSVQVGNSFRFN